MMPQAIEARRQETRILVVDDSELMRRSLRTLLEGRDHWKVCGEASNGQEAVTKFSNENLEKEKAAVVRDYQERAAQNASNRGPAARPGAESQKGKPLTIDEAKDYLRRSGGDKEKARKLATEDGRTFSSNPASKVDPNNLPRTVMVNGKIRSVVGWNPNTGKVIVAPAGQ